MSAPSTLSLAYLEGHPERAAALIERFPTAAAAALLAAARPPVAALVLGRMAPGTAAACLLDLGPSPAGEVLRALPLDAASALLRRIPRERRDPLIDALPDDVAAAVARLLRFPERTAGALLDPLVIALPLDVSAADALDQVRAFPDRVDHEVFVTRRDQTLVGAVALRTLVAAPGAASLESLASPVRARFAARSDAGSLLVSPAWADTHTVPVVDEDGRYLGAVRYDTMVRLSAEGEAEPVSRATVGTLVHLSELCWAGSARLLGELSTALARTARPTGGTHAPR